MLKSLCFLHLNIKLLYNISSATCYLLLIFIFIPAEIHYIISLSSERYFYLQFWPMSIVSLKSRFSYILSEFNKRVIIFQLHLNDLLLYLFIS